MSSSLIYLVFVCTGMKTENRKDDEKGRKKIKWLQ